MEFLSGSRCTAQIGAERVQSVPGPHLQIVELGDRIDLIEFATHVWPELALGVRDDFRTWSVENAA
jgi:hypothetical protein